jgi:hypothetical protein
MAKVCMLQSFHQNAEQFEIMFNKTKFDALPGKIKAIIENGVEAASQDLVWKAIDRYSKDYVELQTKDKVRFYKTPVSILQAQLSAYDAAAANAWRAAIREPWRRARAATTGARNDRSRAPGRTRDDGSRPSGVPSGEVDRQADARYVARPRGARYRAAGRIERPTDKSFRNCGTPDNDPDAARWWR